MIIEILLTLILSVLMINLLEPRIQSLAKKGGNYNMFRLFFIVVILTIFLTGCSKDTIILNSGASNGNNYWQQSNNFLWYNNYDVKVNKSLTIGNNLIIGGDIVSVTAVNATGDIIPASNITYNLGTKAKEWNNISSKDGYFSSGAEIGNKNNAIPSLTVLGGIGGQPIIRLDRQAGTNASFDWSLVGGGLMFTSRLPTSGNVLNLFGTSTTSEAYLGQKDTITANTKSALLSATTFTSAAGTDIVGNDLTIQGGLGTGAGTPGDIKFRTGTALASGTTAQTGTIKLTLNGSTNILNMIGEIRGEATSPGAGISTLAYGLRLWENNGNNNRGGLALVKTGDAVLTLSSDIGVITTISSNGNTSFMGGMVGINTTTPRAKLQVNGQTILAETNATNVSLSSNMFMASTTFIQGAVAVPNKIYVYNTTAGSMDFNTGYGTSTLGGFAWETGSPGKLKMFLRGDGNLGLGTRNANQTFVVVGTGNITGKIILGNNIISIGTAPTLSVCGTSPSIAGTDTKGTVTEGTIATGCTITFSSAYSATPTCLLSSQSALGFTYTTSTTAITITNVGALSSTKVDYICIQ